jgi:hypothetical protein
MAADTITSLNQRLRGNGRWLMTQLKGESTGEFSFEERVEVKICQVMVIGHMRCQN